MDEHLVAVAVIRGPRGVLVGGRVDGIPPWVFVGGKVEPGETAERAAVREAAEEAGVTVKPLGEIGRRVHPRTGRLMAYVECYVVDDAGQAPAPGELSELRWVSSAELDELMPDLFGPVRAHLRDGRGFLDLVSAPTRDRVLRRCVGARTFR